MAPLVLTLVRHGESTDNLTALWAGHRDAPLSSHGVAQASRLGTHFTDVPITAIYTSDLKRARSTAQAIYDKNNSDPAPTFTISTLLREQYFGSAEGEPWDAGAFNSHHLPWEDHRAFELAPEAESLNAVGARADLALRHFIAPHILAAASSDSPQHICVIAHGIFLSEMLFALRRAENPNVRFVKTGGYTNTGWSRVELEPLLTPDELEEWAASTRSEGEGAAEGTFETPPQASTPVTAGTRPTSPYASLDAVALPPRHESLPPPLRPTDSIPLLKVKVIASNQTEHLEGLARKKGAAGSVEHDAKQQKLTAFFAGKGTGLEEWKGKV